MCVSMCFVYIRIYCVYIYAQQGAKVGSIHSTGITRERTGFKGDLKNDLSLSPEVFFAREEEESLENVAKACY